MPRWVRPRTASLSRARPPMLRHSLAARSRGIGGLLLEVLDQGDDQCALGEKHPSNPLDEPELEIFEIGFRGQGGDVQFFQGLRNPFGLGAEKPRCSSFLTMPFVSMTSVCIDGQCSI